MSLSASVTRILTLSGFPPELKTRDIQAAFSEWENDRGGFKIKWVNDTTLMLVFVDATTAKKAYLATIFNPPTQLTSPASHKATVIKPYDGPDAQSIIANVNSRSIGQRGHGSRPSVANGAPFSGGPHIRQASMGLDGNHRRAQSYASNVGSFGRTGGINIAAANGLNTNLGREPSPTLPSLPSHPTLNSLISSSLNPELSPTNDSGFEDGSAPAGAPPKVGDPAKRMVGAALGIRHPGVTSKTPTDPTVKDVTKAMGGLAVAVE